jgi:5-methylcytosine-specific restriction endonuclease McrA
MTVHVSPDAHPALVLNADYRPLSYYPLSLWSWQDAIKAVFLDRVNIVSEYDLKVRSPSFEVRLPSVVSLKTYIKPSRHPAFTRFNVFLRDRFQCQYCGSPEDLTFDHLVPRSRGGHTTWANVITACRALATSERATSPAARSACGPSTSLSPRRSTTCITTGGCFRRTTCTRAGWTTCTGMRSWSLKSQLASSARVPLGPAGVQTGPFTRRQVCFPVEAPS